MGQPVPILLKSALRRVRTGVASAGARLIPVRHRCAARNVIHCCVQKTASQWIRQIFADPVTYRHSGMRPFHYQSHIAGGFDSRKLHERVFDEAFPEATIVSPIYIDYAGYRSIPKPGPVRTFFVARDPRDVVVSWYFSVMHSHGAMGQIPRIREHLKQVDLPTGLRFVVEHLRDYGLFDALDSWASAGAGDPDVRIVRFEDLVGESGYTAFRDLFDHLDIRMPEEELAALLDRYSFARLSGRDPGQEDKQSHYRKGTAGDWRNHFDDELVVEFDRSTGNLAARLGYE